MNPRCQWRCLLAQIFTDIFRSVFKANEVRPTDAFIDNFCTSIIAYILSLYSALGLKSFANHLCDEVASICGIIVIFIIVAWIFKHFKLLNT